jgi:DNA invertase Pin-like site-specific DNA recombinase
MRAIGYIRVSSEEQASEGVSLDAQRAKVQGYADLYGLELVAVEVDAGVSAKTIDRPALARALAMLDRGEANGLVIAKLDRLSRSVGDWDHLIAEYFGERAGKKLWSVADSIDTRTAAGRLVLNVLMSVAQWEREAIGERTRDALQHKIRQGERCGKVRFGHDLGPNGVQLIDNPAEQEGLTLLRELAAEGRSLRSIARELTRRGIPTKEGRPRWDHSSVKRILARTA